MSLPVQSGILSQSRGDWRGRSKKAASAWLEISEHHFGGDSIYPLRVYGLIGFWLIDRFCFSASLSQEVELKKLLITTDLGAFKAYTMEEDRFSTAPRLELREGFEMTDGHERLTEKVSDREGPFGRGSTANRDFGSGGNGERHNFNLEQRRRGMKKVADRIAALCAEGNYDSCLFAAPSEINHQILELLPERIRAKVEKTLPLDLVHASKPELLRQFS